MCWQCGQWFKIHGMEPRPGTCGFHDRFYELFCCCLNFCSLIINLYWIHWTIPSMKVLNSLLSSTEITMVTLQCHLFQWNAHLLCLWDWLLFLFFFTIISTYFSKYKASVHSKTNPWPVSRFLCLTLENVSSFHCVFIIFWEYLVRWSLIQGFDGLAYYTTHLFYMHGWFKCSLLCISWVNLC